MPVPQNVLDALDAVQADAEGVAAAQQAALASAESAAALSVAACKAAVALTSARQHQATDLATLQALLQQTYGT